MIKLVCLGVIGLLEYLVGSDGGFFNNTEALYFKRSCIYIYPPDFTVAFFNGVNSPRRISNKLRTIIGMFPKYQNESFLSLVLQCFYFVNDLLCVKAGA